MNGSGLMAGTAAAPLIVGDARLDRVVDIPRFDLPLEWLFPDADPAALEEHRHWLEPGFMLGRGSRPLHSFGRGARRRACHPRRYLCRRAQASSTAAGLEHARDERLSFRARCHRSCAGGYRHRLLYPSPCRPRRLEYEAAQWAMGTDVSQCPLSDRTDGARPLAAAGSSRKRRTKSITDRMRIPFCPSSKPDAPTWWMAVTSCSMD